MSRVWQLQEAKSRFSELVDEALTQGPQIITRRGVETAIILSYTEYRKLLLNQQNISSFFRESPLAAVGDELELTRDPDPAREGLAL